VNLEFFAFLPQLDIERVYLSYTAGILVSIVATAYAIQIYKEHLHVNIATWMMIVLIDILGLVLAFSTGNAQPSIHIAWLVTDTLILVTAVSMRANWHWRYIETICLILFVTSLAWWHFDDSVWSIVGYLVACFFTLLPQAIQYWHDRRLAKKSAWIWIMNSIAIVMTLLSLHEISFEYSVAALGLLVMCLAMVMIALK
jgi:hypothetical protein